MARDWSIVTTCLNGIDRYNPDNIPLLEEYVQHQVEDGTYNLDANLALLKLYQFNPVYFKPGVCAQILLKSLTNLPHADYTLCKCLIDNSRLEDDGVLQNINDLSDLLERCQFREFWDLLRQEKSKYGDLVARVNGFDSGIIEFVMYIVSKTYQTIDYDELKEIVGNLKDEALLELIQAKGWKKQEDNYVFVANHEENIKTKNIVEKIKFDDVSAVMSAAIRSQNLV